MTNEDATNRRLDKDKLKDGLIEKARQWKESQCSTPAIKQDEAPSSSKRAPLGIKKVALTSSSGKGIKRKAEEEPITTRGKKAYYELLGNSISKDEFIHMQTFDADGNMIGKEIYATNKFSKFVASVINSHPEKAGVIIKTFLNVLNNL